MANQFFIMPKLNLLFLIFQGCIYCEAGTMVTLSPLEMATVCHVGDQLELTCTITNGTFIRWSFTVRNEEGRFQEYPRLINSEDESQQASEITVNSTTFNFMRTSAQGYLPLVSTLVISSVSVALNGTLVHCIDLGASMTTSTIIHIEVINPPHIGITATEYWPDNVTVSVKWNQEIGVLYNVSISPSIPVKFTGSTSVQLPLSYNVDYMLRIGASTPCRNNATAYLVLNYINCGNPLAASNDSTLRITSYNDELTLEGTTINFSCPTGFKLILNGTSQSTCMSDGQWKPDPREVACVEIFNCDPPFPPSSGYIDSYNRTAEGLTVNFICQNSSSCLDGPQETLQGLMHTAVCTLDGNWEPNLEDFCSSLKLIPNLSNSVNTVSIILATSLALLLSSNIFIFIIGFVCGHCCCRANCKKAADKNLMTDTTNDHHPSHSPPAIYENLQLSTVNNEEQGCLDLELADNMAYGQLQQ